MADFFVVAIILLLCIPGIKKIIRAARGKETCECPQDCSHCRIQCRSNRNYYGVSKKREKSEPADAKALSH